MVEGPLIPGLKDHMEKMAWAEEEIQKKIRLMLIDTHSHLQFKAYKDDLPEVIARCNKKEMIINVVGTQKNTSKQAVELAEKHDNIYATIGLHPIQEYKVKVKEESDNFTSRGEDFDFDYYNELAKHPKVIAIGETGLDKFHIPKDKTQEEIFEKQKKIFLQHAKLATKHNLPLVIHVRDAHKEMLQVLQSSIFNPPGEPLSLRDSPSLQSSPKGVIHCFTGTPSQAQQYIEMGFYLGFTGITTFPPKKTNPKPQEELLEVIKNTPLNRILVETDAPYLAPQAHRGKRCEPWMVEEVVKFIAEFRGIELEEMSQVVLENSRKLFKKIK